MKLLNSQTPRHTNILTDYILLMKPELTLLSVLTAVGSAFLALHGSKQYSLLVHTFIGTILVGSAAGVLNQYIERRSDAMMKRTEHRPIPAGRIPSAKALLLGIVLGCTGLSYLALFTNWIAVSLSMLTLMSYLAIYTPLKRKTPFAILIGGIPGALPPLIGWAVVQNGVSMEAWSLFFILRLCPRQISIVDCTGYNRRRHQSANTRLFHRTHSCFVDAAGCRIDRSVLLL
jgi:protoheme IX farnesyltransferase